MEMGAPAVICIFGGGLVAGGVIDAVALALPFGPQKPCQLTPIYWSFWPSPDSSVTTSVIAETRPISCVPIWQEVHVVPELEFEPLHVACTVGLAARAVVMPPAATRADTARATTRRPGLRMINCLSPRYLDPRV